MKTAIIIPARYGSTRFPGKPLVKIGGKTMLERVFAIGQKAAAAHENVTVAVATEDTRIKDYCDSIGAPCFITSPDCATGSDRVLEAAGKAGGDFDFLFSLQGDAPFTPPEAIAKMLAVASKNPAIEVITPVVRLRWAQLDSLRESKKITPFTGTTAVIDNNGKALWFSKNILPALRKEETLRETEEFSPVYQHVGLYGYRSDTLKHFAALPQSHYETLEGLEQLRFLENGISIHTVVIDADTKRFRAGIDSPEDVAKAERLLEEYGELL